MALGTTVDDLCERVRRDALLSLFGPVYTLDGAVSASATSLILTESPEHMTTGSIVAVDGELFLVRSIDEPSRTLTVVPGHFGSTTAAHADGSLVEVDPRVPKAALIDWAEQEIRTWKRQLFRVETLALPVTRAERTYDLTGVTDDIMFLLEVRQQPQSATGDDFSATWTGDAWPRVEARLLRDMPAAEFTSGYALQLTHFPRYGLDLRVAYASDFDLSTFDLTTDLVTDVGLEAGFLLVLEQGVRWRALSAGLVSRSDWRATGMARDAEEVSLLDVVRATDMARSLRDRALADEAVALRGRYPYLSM
jgi:hypothetical protein